MREDYINSIFGAHSARSTIETGKNLARAGLTFSGPLMAADELDSDDEQGGAGGAAGRGDVGLEELDDVDWEAEEKKEMEREENHD